MTKTASFFSQLHYQNHYAQLGETFSISYTPQALREPSLVCFNDDLASRLSLPEHQVFAQDYLSVFSGQTVPKECQSIAHRYAGHQYGKFNHFLGDGRSLHLCEIQHGEQLYDICLKGTGKTPLAANTGDGRLGLSAAIKEYLFCIALQGLDIPTSEGLCVIRGKPEIKRQDKLESCAVLTRLAGNFIRFGHFEDFHYSGNHAAVKQLADFCLQHYFPDCLKSDDPYHAMFDKIVCDTARLIAYWQGYAFVHGNMNSDNQAILGITIDHGTVEFMQIYQADRVSTSDDVKGLFAFDQQMMAGAWNCHIFGKTLSSLIEQSKIEQSLANYQQVFFEQYLKLMRQKLGLANEKTKDNADIELIAELLNLMEQNQLDYSATLRSLSSFNSLNSLKNDESDNHRLVEKLTKTTDGKSWLEKYFNRIIPDQTLRQQQMNAVNPRFILHQGLLKDAIDKALEGDYQALMKIEKELKNPF